MGVMKFCPQCQRDYPLSQRFCLEDGRLLSLRDPYHLVGRTLADKYRLDALIGIGGMGAVYSAHHLGIDRHVAIKILQPNMALGNEQLMSLFEREARMAGHLTHENIANVMDAGRTTDGLSYIAMEWLEGRTLEDVLLAEAPMSFERAGAILHQIASALDAAHSQRIVHRDLKPSNVMLVERQERGSTRSPHVKVLDFGIAKVVSETTAAAVSAPMGTPHYASPEQFKLGGHIDGRADIYSLGVVLYRMLSGEVPFQTASMHELVQRQLNDPPPPIRTVRKDAPEKIEKLLARMLAKEPDDRPQSASAAAEEYFEALGMTPTESREGIRSRENMSTAKFDLPTKVDAPRTTNEYVRAVTGYLSSHRKWSALAAIVIVGALVGLAFYWRYRSQLVEDRKRVAFATFENASGNSQFDVLQRIAPQLLMQRLSQVPALKIKYFQQAGDPLPVNQAAQVVNARSLVTGAIRQSQAAGGGLELTANIEDISKDGVRGAKFFSESVTGARSDDVFSMIDQLSAQIARYYGASLANVRSTSDLTTRSFDAYQYYQAGCDRVLAHDFDAAVKNLESATNIDERFGLAWFQLSRAQQFSGNPKKAKEAVDRAYELRDRMGERERMFIDGYYLWLSQKQRPKAIESFERMLTVFPNDKEALLSIAIISRESKQYDKSIEFARRATAEDPRFGAAWNTMGYSYLLKKDIANAIDAFKRYGEAEPQNPNPFDSLGDTYIEARLYDEAMAAYQRSFEIQPDFFAYGALWKRSEVFFRKGDYSSATSNAEQFVRNSNDRYRYLGELTLARVALYKGKLSEALDHFKKAQISTGAAEIATAIQANILWREGLLLAGVRQYDKALERMEESKKLDPRSTSRTWPYLTTLAMSGKCDQAQKEFASLELQKAGGTDFELRAYDAQSRGDYITAIGLWKNLRDQTPAISRGYELGRAYAASGQTADAERELRELVKAPPVPDLGSMSPINPIYDTRYILGHYELAKVLETNGKPDEARKYYQTFLSFWGSGDLKLEEIEAAKKK